MLIYNVDCNMCSYAISGEILFDVVLEGCKHQQNNPGHELDQTEEYMEEND